MNEKDLYSMLKEYSDSGVYPFHMPGHKRNIKGADPYSIDITEIDGFDDLHSPSGIIEKSLSEASSFYGTKDTFLSVNGSTGGILASLCAAIPKGGRALVQKNSHISVYNALFINGVTPSFIGEDTALAKNAETAPSSLRQGESSLHSPQEIFNTARLRAGDLKDRMEMAAGPAVSPAQVEDALSKDPENNIVVITSPSYDGHVADIGRISDIVHSRGGILIVDEAHGAHFSMHPYFPVSAVKLGADIVVQSLHKTLPALTQTALIHNVTGAVPSEEIKRYLDIFTTSSPSYVLMASAFRCIRMMIDRGDELFNDYVTRLRHFRNETEKLTNIRVLPADGDAGDIIPADGPTRPDKRAMSDPSKILIDPGTSGISAEELYDILRIKYKLQPEAVIGGRVLAMTSVMDSDEGFQRLANALRDIDENIQDPR